MAVRHQTTGVATQAGVKGPGRRTIKRDAATKQKRDASSAEDDKYTTFEIASHDRGHKTLSVIGKITMETGLKLLALAGKESKA